MIGKFEYELQYCRMDYNCNNTWPENINTKAIGFCSKKLQRFKIKTAVKVVKKVYNLNYLENCISVKKMALV
jgi:hypothetical protein